MARQNYEWQQQLFWLKELRIPRFRRNEEIRDLSFHIFVDANQNAYAAVLFARTEETKVYVQLLAARSRVEPNKKDDDSLDEEEKDVSFWSDFTIVLVWIKRDKARNTLYLMG